MTVLAPDYPRAKDYLSAVPGVDVVLYSPQHWPQLPEAALRAEVLIPPFLTTDITPELFSALPHVRLVQLLTAGAEAWIDAVPHGVLLANCRGAHGGTTAEWVLAALLALYRKFPTFLTAQQAGRWDYQQTDTICGKRVLIVGAGDIGQQLQRRLAACDASVTLVGRSARTGVAGMAELSSLLPQHDVVVLAVPLTVDTRHLVDADFLSRMPDGAILINVARGPIVVTDALHAELAAGRLRAALDVTDPEPLPAGHPLWTVQGLLLTPHIAGNPRGYHERAFAVAARQIASFAQGEQVANLV